MADDPFEGQLSIYYDGGCPLCRAEIDHYRRCDGTGRLAFIDVAREVPAPALGSDLDRDEALRRFHVRTADGRLISGAAAFARLWQALPGWRWLGSLVELRVLGIQPLLLIAELVYRLSLPLRPRLARLIARLR
jgi:predicted DCC family thiol-disulfide oxidoreductase YuxK